MRTLRTLTLATIASLLAALAWPRVHAWIGEEGETPPFAEQPVAELPGEVSTAPASDEAPVVQVAILLDTSSSMNGLIHQARSQLWRVVNELEGARHHGKAPRLEIALYEYGNSNLEPEAGFLRRVTPFTDDLDTVSESLFALSTGGGSEHCGEVIARSLTDLEWSREQNALRLIYIAGNEGFSQGPVDFRGAVADAREAGIIVNTVHCGSEGDGIDGEWSLAAQLGGGEAMVIDHNAVAVHIAAPQDTEIARLGAELNTTYLNYGSAGDRGSANQARQDNNARSLGGSSMVQRSVSKASGYYDNYRWDLVDAVDKRAVRLADLDSESLPPELRGMSQAEIAKVVESKKVERKRIQSQIKELASERTEWLAEQAGEQGASTLDQVMIDTLHDQAEAHGFEFVR
jgi:hypothetical protein